MQADDVMLLLYVYSGSSLAALHVKSCKCQKSYRNRLQTPCKASFVGLQMCHNCVQEVGAEKMWQHMRYLTV